MAGGNRLECRGQFTLGQILEAIMKEWERAKEGMMPTAKFLWDRKYADGMERGLDKDVEWLTQMLASQTEVEESLKLQSESMRLALEKYL